MSDPNQAAIDAAVKAAVAEALAKVKGKRDPATLTKAQELMVAGLPEAMRADVTKAFIEANIKRDGVVTKNRTEFSATVNANGNVVIRGLGNKFPLGIRKDSLKILLDNSEALRKLIG